MNNTTHSLVPQRFRGAWKTYRLGEIASFFKGSGNLLKTDLSLNAKRRCIHYGELFTTYGECITAVLHGTDREGTFFRSLRNDVLMPASDVTPNGLATASCISISDVILGGDILVIRVPEEILNGTFLAYIIRASHNQVMQLVSGTTVFHLYARDMANFRFIAPSVREQNAIVSVLSDLDAAIDASDALIVKKRAVKQSAMQQLLTGEMRLPGFSGEWETKRLGSIGRCLRGVSYDPTTDLASYDKEGTVRLLRANNVQDAVVTVTDIQYVESHRVADFQVMQPDDILICMANGSKALVGKAGLFRIQDGYTYAFGAFMGCFRVDSTLADARFVFYLLQTGEFRDYIGLVLAGSSINNLKPSDIEEAGFRLPARNEQTAIADILSAMDAEIDALERRRDKVRAIKKAMMQELLTGRVRLAKSA